MDRYTYKRPKGYKWIKMPDGTKVLQLPKLNPTCMCCGKANGNDYYEAFDMVKSEYGYLCDSCVNKMESEKIDSKKH